jgi:hypothetical protein
MHLASLSAPSRPMRLRAPTHRAAAAAAPEPTRVLTPLRELALLPLIEDTPPEAEADFSRCGWFDSSLELAAGLQVVEFIDALPPDLPFELA